MLSRVKRALGVFLVLLAGCQSSSKAERLDRAGLHERRADRAVEEFTQAIELDSTHPEYFRHRGDARMRQGDVDGAIADFSESIRLAPEAVTYLHRARARARKKLGQLAIVDASAAIELEPSAGAYRLRAKLRLENGDPDGAKEDEARAAELE